MIVENQLAIPFLQWLPDALLAFVAVISVLLVLGSMVGFLSVAFRQGPTEAVYAVANVLFKAVPDVMATSPRRTFALAKIAFYEAMRNKVLVAVLIFLLVMLFGSWFLDSKNDSPVVLYISVVFGATTYLIFLLSLFLSVFSLPNDIKNKTIYTIVTKPVRPLEIILGRVLGFGAIGSLFLVLVMFVSYAFVQRGLTHEHQINVDSIEEITAQNPIIQNGEVIAQIGDTIGYRGKTTEDAHHSHKFEIYLEEGKGSAQTDFKSDHYHTVSLTVPDDGIVTADSFTISPPQGMFRSRVPVYASRIDFLGRNGERSVDNTGKSVGIFVGKEWMYHSYIEGGSEMAAVWTFKDLSPESFEETLPLELNLSVFRLSKGDMSRGIAGEIYFRKPSSSLQVKSEESVRVPFIVKEFEIQSLAVPRELGGLDIQGNPTENKIDVLKDLVNDKGEVELWLQCTDTRQYLGAARASIYVRTPDSSYFLNFVKAYIGLWIQMVLVVAFGVFFSTFLNGPISMLTTLLSIIIGSFKEHIFLIATSGREDNQLSVGPIEAALRVLTQTDSKGLDLIAADTTNPLLVYGLSALQWIDYFVVLALRAFSNLFPDFSQLNFSNSLTAGYNINFYNQLLPQLLTAFGFVLVTSLVSYFFLKTKEIAK
ncbi:MAG: hypothetical protein MPJ24_04090 [Pirellulaceae bacterium]|nr:hypothetical protein [Pirellulaceae bacterium]